MKNIFKKLILILTILSFFPITAFALIPIQVNQGGTGISFATSSQLIQGNGISPFSSVVVGSGLNLTGGVLTATGSASTLAIGSSISSSTANSILFVSATSSLAQDNPNFTYSPGVLGLSGTGLFGNGGTINLGAATQLRYDGGGNTVLDNFAGGQELAFDSSGSIILQTPSSGHGISINGSGNTTISGTLNLNGHYILPNSAGTAGQILTANGGTSVIWANATTTIPFATSTQITFGDTSNALTSDPNFTYDPTGQIFNVGWAGTPVLAVTPTYSSISFVGSQPLYIDAFGNVVFGDFDQDYTTGTGIYINNSADDVSIGNDSGGTGNGTLFDLNDASSTITLQGNVGLIYQNTSSEAFLQAQPQLGNYALGDINDKFNGNYIQVNDASSTFNDFSGGALQFWADNAGDVTASSSFVAPVFAASGTPVVLSTNVTAGSKEVVLRVATQTATSGTNNLVSITPTYNQTSGGAVNNDLLIDRNETAVGSGAQDLINAMNGNTEEWQADHSGNTTQNGSLTLSTSGKAISLPNAGINRCMGTGTLGAGGTVTITSGCVVVAPQLSEIFVTDTGGAGVLNIGSLRVATTTLGSFTVVSSNNLDTSTFNWIIFN